MFDRTIQRSAHQPIHALTHLPTHTGVLRQPTILTQVNKIIIRGLINGENTSARKENSGVRGENVAALFLKKKKKF